MSSKAEDRKTRTPSRGISNQVKKGKRHKEQKENQKDKKTRENELIKDYPFFRAMKPRQRYRFRSDYFMIDDKYATILTIMSHKGADDRLRYFWGIELIPRNLDPAVSVRRFEQAGRMSESWIDQHQGKAEGLMDNQMGETGKDGSFSSKHRLNKEQGQLVEIATDLMNGSSYLRFAIRLVVKAPSLEELDDAVNKISRQYKDRFDTVYATPYTGEQKQEMSHLFKPVDDKLGRNFMFSSAELAGNYSLVTRGIEDPTGEYIGQMEGDVNNSAVLMDLDNYNSHVVIAGRAVAQTLSGWEFNGARGVDLWGAKLGTAAMVRNQRAVHLVLNSAKVSEIGVNLDDVTAKVDMTQGDINPLELFGDPERESQIGIFAAHTEKIKLMIEQLEPMRQDSNASTIRNEIDQILNDFYVDARMWMKNAPENLESLRILGIPHDEVPRLPVLKSYVDMEYKKQLGTKNRDSAVVKAYNYLRGVVNTMLSTNGDLFNTTTSSIIDEASHSNRVIYNFSELLSRGRGVMMSQFVNALGFSVGNLTEGDTVILHGAEQLDPDIKDYVRQKFNELYEKGVRVVYIYNDVEEMLNDRNFSRFDDADYTLLGGMAPSVIDRYESTLKQEVPVVLKGLLDHRENYRYYLRRDFDNIVFANDLQMGFDR